MSQTKRLTAPVAPGGTIGILGGGQLGRMLALAAARLGLKAHVYSDEIDAPAFQVADCHTSGAFDDRDALTAFAQTCDAVTFEFENIPASALEQIARVRPAYPGAKALRILQDRFEEKSFVKSLGLNTAPFFAVESEKGARSSFDAVGGSGVLKTRRLGYDGKGQAKVASADEAAAAIKSFKFAPSILESFVDFSFEASVVAARGIDGTFAAYDPPENSHEHHILRRSIVPGRLTPAQGFEAKAIAKKVADALDYVGVLAVELFVRKDGALLVNEIAPRVHNSGHWTLEACTVSQFEQHIRAVAGWPLGDPARHADAEMQNIIGEEAADWRAFAKRPGALHLYGKSEIRAGRKMGHFTTLFPLTKTPPRQ
jgi:5-(carboxyamino)imidazole ribonucleotide synthase